VRTLLCCFLYSLSAIAIEPPITAIAFAPDGKSVVVGSQAGVKILTWPDLKFDRAISTELANVHDIAFSPDGVKLAVVGGSPAEKGTIELWQWPDGKLQRRFNPHKDVIHSLAWTADSRTIATASADQLVKLHDATTGKTKIAFEGHSRGVLAVVFLPGDKEVVTAGSDETLRLWDCATGKLERNLSNHTRAVTGLAVRPASDRSESPYLASIADDRTVRIWQPTLGRMVRFARVASEPRAIAWSRDGASIVVACKDGAIRVIDPDSVEMRATVPVVDGIAYSFVIAGDGSLLVGGRDGQLKRAKK